MLSEYFAPLNFQTVSLYLMLIIFFDIFGSLIKNKIDPDNATDSRIVNWLIGLTAFIFIWFIFSLFIPYSQINISLSILLLFLLSIYQYLSVKSYKSFILEVKSLVVPVLFIIPFLFPLFVKSSLPPYYGDEMAYHYIAPSALLNLSKVQYLGGLYADLPRNLNIFWEIVFSLTKTYSIARMFHFSILLTSLMFAYKFLRNKINLLSALIFIIVFLGIPQDIILTSTLGYIDVGAYSLILIAIVFLLGYFIESNVKYLYLSSIFWAMNLGTKYTGLTAFIALILTFSVIYFLNRMRLRWKLNFKNIIVMIILFLIFGGFWYLKNFILYGNPIFPFIFKCWGSHVEVCPQLGGFFGDWTTKVTIENLGLIISQLFVSNKILQASSFVLMPLLYWLQNKRIKLFLITIYLSIFLEFMMLKFFSGFYSRYHQHMQIYVILCISIILSLSSKIIIIEYVRKIVLFLLIITSLFYYSSIVYYNHTRYFIKDYEIKYALGKINIYDWIHVTFPEMEEVIKWCDYPGSKITKLARFDPDLIWFTHNGLSRVFMMKCVYENPLDYTEKSKEDFWVNSINPCLAEQEVVKKYPFEKDYQYDLRKVNNSIVCRSMYVIPNLYFYDHTKVK